MAVNKIFGDAELIQSTGAFLQGELERFDANIYNPIAEYTWSRDVDLRQDVSIADETTSFALADFALGASGTGHGTKAWASQADGALPTVQVGFNKTVSPVTPWAMSLDWSIFELEKSIKLGRPIDSLKHDAMRIRHQRDIDEMVYVGDKEVGVKGLTNHESVSVDTGASTFDISKASDKEILDLVNHALEGVYKNTSYMRVPNTILLPTSFAPRFSDAVALNGTGLASTLAEWVKSRSLYKTVMGGELNVHFCRWLNKENQEGGKPRIVVYQRDADVVRFPLVTLQNTPIQQNGIKQSTTYYGALGALEIVRPELFNYVELKK